MRTIILYAHSFNVRFCRWMKIFLPAKKKRGQYFLRTLLTLSLKIQRRYFALWSFVHLNILRHSLTYVGYTHHPNSKCRAHSLQTRNQGLELDDLTCIYSILDNTLCKSRCTCDYYAHWPCSSMTVCLLDNYESYTLSGLSQK